MAEVKTAHAAQTKLIGRQHWHFCSNRECRKQFLDACPEARSNPLCVECRGWAQPSLWTAVQAPHECCRTDCAQITHAPNLVLYKLAGPGPWFQCRTCARCHGWPNGFNPNPHQEEN